MCSYERIDLNGLSLLTFIGKLQLFHKKMGRRKERKKAQKNSSTNKKKLQKPTVNAQKLQFCKLQKKYAPRGTEIHNLIALSYYLHTKSSTKKVYSRENCVGRKSKDQRTRSSDLGYKK